MAKQCILCGQQMGWLSATGSTEIQGVRIEPVCSSCCELCSTNPEKVIDTHRELFREMLSERRASLFGDDGGAAPLPESIMVSPDGTAAINALDPNASLRQRKLLKMYGDAYLVAKTVVGIGSLLKVAGVLFAVAILAVTLMIISGLTGSNADAALFIGIFLAIVIGLMFYAFGTLIAAQGQITKASLDSAVNSSPFLTDEFRARIMSI